MEKERLFEILDIDEPKDFKFYENFESLMESDEHIEEDLIKETLSFGSPDMIEEHSNSFFDSFISNIPEDETELLLVIDAFRNNIESGLRMTFDDESLSELAAQIYKFRKWYAIENNALNLKDNHEISVRDARYELMASKLLGDDVKIDFGNAITSGPDSYEVRLRDIIE